MLLWKKNNFWFATKFRNRSSARLRLHAGGAPSLKHKLWSCRGSLGTCEFNELEPPLPTRGCCPLGDHGAVRLFSVSVCLPPEDSQGRVESEWTAPGRLVPGCQDVEAERWGEWKGCFLEDIFCRINLPTPLMACFEHGATPSSTFVRKWAMSGEKFKKWKNAKGWGTCRSKGSLF